MFFYPFFLTLKQGKQASTNITNFSLNRAKSNNESSSELPICRHFIKGRCSYGNNCKFKHPGSSDSILGVPSFPVSPMPPMRMPITPVPVHPFAAPFPAPMALPMPGFPLPPIMPGFPPLVNIPPPTPTIENKKETAWEKALRIHCDEKKIEQEEFLKDTPGGKLETPPKDKKSEKRERRDKKESSRKKDKEKDKEKRREKEKDREKEKERKEKARTRDRERERDRAHYMVRPPPARRPGGYGNIGPYDMEDPYLRMGPYRQGYGDYPPEEYDYPPEMYDRYDYPMPPYDEGPYPPEYMMYEEPGRHRRYRHEPHRTADPRYEGEGPPPHSGRKKDKRHPHPHHPPASGFAAPESHHASPPESPPSSSLQGQGGMGQGFKRKSQSSTNTFIF
eukprot:GCRY01001064.1.p1 GENE.GCRY01001064.1~~GCRY01001064.1.p1  ORF type:complete len:392 (+),score=61.40 GCRY01001064.1:894-2069(+)